MNWLPRVDARRYIHWSAFVIIAGSALNVFPVDARGEEVAMLEPADMVEETIALRPGEFTWTPERSPAGRVLVSIGLESQTAYVYRGGELIGATTISSGRRGYETPRGIYPILQKKRQHRSNLYDDAPMPFMQRLTWDGIALHAGELPGHPASHGCIRLPKRFAKLLYDVTTLGTTVIVGSELVTAEKAAELAAAAHATTAESTVLPTSPPARSTADLNRAMFATLADGSR